MTRVFKLYVRFCIMFGVCGAGCIMRINNRHYLF